MQQPQNPTDVLLPHSIGSELLKGVTGWSALPLTSNWKNYESTAFAPAEYKMSMDGLVRVRGLVQPAAVGQNTIGVLPSGFHPSLTKAGTQGGEVGFACPASNAESPTIIRLDVRSNGEIWPEVSFSGTTTNFYVFLDPISFYVE